MIMKRPTTPRKLKVNHASPTTAVPPRAKPFMKWAGGKTDSVPTILDVLPERISTYFEPMVGGGAVFFALADAKRFENCRLGDTNDDLMTCYGVIKHDVEALIALLKTWDHSKSRFATLRAEPKGKLVYRAARMIYLNRTCFNGLYRVNRSGQFNVPFGRYTNPLICDEDNLRRVAAVLRDAGLVTGPYDVLNFAKPGDAVYIDPPYVPVSKTSSFTQYGPNAFGTAEHVKLAQAFYDLAARGVSVALSNSDTEFVRILYGDYHVRELKVKRRINSKAANRGAVPELLITANCRGD